MKVIITGVDGNFGGHAAKTILTRMDRKDVIFTSPNRAAVEKWVAEGIDARYADYNDPAQLVGAFRGGDVMLLISVPQVGEKRRNMQKNAIDGAVDAGVSKIIYTSTVGAGIEANKALVKVDHEFTENYIWQTGLKWNILRDSQYTEAMIASYEQAANSNGLLMNNSSDGLMSLVTRSDCAEAAACAAAGVAKDNVIYDITGPEQVSVEYLVRVGNEVTGGNVRYQYITDEEMFAHFDSLGIPRTTEGDFSAAAFPYCSDDMVTYGRAIRLGQMSMISDHVEFLTGKKPMSIRQVFENAEKFRLGDRTATD